ncbi:MAG TPA: enoyl-CoA hydratase/isomerase family protein, partial [Vicinamibacterales bacterium]|nr:enoyl-CoA hydratase/isomerase family protein [Vicinamibacterales bacterium]
MPTSHTIFDIDGHLAFFTFNRPDARNAMTWGMYDALVAACDRVDGTPEVRVLVLRGAGGKAFASGTDIGQFTSFASRDDAIAYERRLDGVIDRIERVDAVTIAQVEGAATGGGCAMALACDLRVCTPAARFGVPIARTLGNCLSAVNYARMIELIGPARVKDVLFTGRFLDAAEAASLGLVTRMAEAGTIDATVRELADTIGANAPLTIRATKEAVRRILAGRRPPVDQADDLIAACYSSDDFKEGVSAFIARRPP